MKLNRSSSAQFISRYRRGFLFLFVATTAGVSTAQADSPTVTFLTPNTSLLKAGNWSGSGNPPTANQTGIIAEGASSNPIGWNNNTNVGATIGDLDFVSGSTTLVIGDYTTKSANTNEPITLAGSTLNSVANTVIANSSGNTITFENDVAPSGDDLTESGLTTYTLGNTSNVIQSTANSNVIIDDVVTGTGASLTYLGGGVAGSSAGATLELGAGSANDVTGHAAANAPTPANAGSFTSAGTVQTGDVNSFTGGLTIGDVGGVSNAGTVKVDGANALPTSGTVTVNSGSQLLVNGSASYGGVAQSLVLNGNGTAANANGALATTSGNISTWKGTVTLASNSAINVAGSTGSLTATGAVGGTGQLQTVGTGTLVLNGANTFSGGTLVKSGAVIAGSTTALGTKGVTVSGGSLSSSITSAVALGGTLSLSSGSIALNTQGAATFSLSSVANFTMSGGTLTLSYNMGNVGSINDDGTGSFSITGGTLNLSNSAYNYASTYNVINGFQSGSVSGLAITNYDTADYTANLSNAGVLSFTATSTPEPSAYLLGLGAMAMFATMRLRRGVSRAA